MKKYFVLVALAVILICPPLSSIKAEKEDDGLAGKQTWNFFLAPTEDRLINYGHEYYGKDYLIITFFPAAFTPV